MAATGMAVGEIMDTLTDEGHELLSAAATRAEEAGVADEQELLEEVPYEAIGEYVADNEIDIVVIASQGTSNLASQHLENVADRVIRGVDTPILVVSPADYCEQRDNDETEVGSLVTSLCVFEWHRKNFSTQLCRE